MYVLSCTVHILNEIMHQASKHSLKPKPKMTFSYHKYTKYKG